MRKTFVESILCEFGQKFNILVQVEFSRPDFSGVMDQMRRTDARLAQEFDGNIMKYIQTGTGRAKESVRQMWAEYLSATHELDRTRAIFLAYFHIELNFLRSGIGCNIWKLDSLRTAFDLLILKARNDYRGLSIDKLAELGARIEMHYLSCFHVRLKLAYGLDESERRRATAPNQKVATGRFKRQDST